MEAGQKQVRLNTLMNQIVKSHVEWHSSAAIAGFIPVRRELIKRLMDPLTEKQIDDLARYVVKDLVGTALLIIVKNRNTNSVVELLERWLRVSGFDYHLEVEGDHRMYVIQHNMGRKWSYYLARLFEEVAYELEMVRPDIKTTESALYVMMRKN